MRCVFLSCGRGFSACTSSDKATCQNLFGQALREIAYLSTLRIAERITDIDWTRTEEDIEKLDVDWEWLKRLITITESHKKLP